MSFTRIRAHIPIDRIREIIVNEFRLVVLLTIFGCAAVTALAFLAKFRLVFELAANLRGLAFGISAIAGCGLVADYCLRQGLGIPHGRPSISRAALAMSAGVILINGLFVMPDALAEADSCQPNLRVTTANTYVSNEKPEEALAALKAIDADILVVQEMHDHIRHELEPYRYFVTDRPGGKQQSYMPVGIFSRWPLEDTEVWMSDLYRPVIDTIVVHPRGRFRLLASHPLPAIASVPAADRERVLREIGKRARRSTLPVVVAGDLNVTPWSPSWKLVTDGAVLESVRKGRGQLASWPTGSPVRIPIDHVLTSHRDFETCDVALSETPGSDHLALTADLRF